MEPFDIIEKFYAPGSRSHGILIQHGKLVARKALDIARIASHIRLNMRFIENAALLHDIGMYRTNADRLGCTGALPYIRHGVEGRKILDRMGLFDYGLVCERHVGVGLTADDIKALGLPLPVRDMMPVTDEEKLICYADKFFSKNRENGKEKTLDEICRSLEPFGHDKVARFLKLKDYFEPDES